MDPEKYTADDIEILSDNEHVRKRLAIYFGSNHKTTISIPNLLVSLVPVEYEFVPATYKAVGEIFDNCQDEFAQISSKNKTITITANTQHGKYTIADNGRGVPIEKHKTGKYVPEIVFGSLRSGRNFSDDRQAGVQGQNGVGSSCTCFTSSVFDVEITRDNKKYIQTFKYGGTMITTPKITKTSSTKTGTKISFKLDPTVYSDVALPEELMNQRAAELAALNPDITVVYNNKKYKFKKGLETLVASHTDDYFKFEHTINNVTMEFFVIFNVHDNIDENIFTYVNSSPLFDGGICNTQFMNAFFTKTIDHLKPSAKKQKSEITKNDIRQGLTVLGSLKIANPEFNSQSKTHLVNPGLRKEMMEMLDVKWKQFTRKNKNWLDSVLNRSFIRHHADANKKAIHEHKKTISKKVPGLTDAASSSRTDCQLLITEGVSAASMITDARDPHTTASLPLTGKVNNVFGCTPAQILKMGKLTNLLAAIGLIPGKKATRSDLRFGKIVIATDSDVDGGDIFTLLINLLYTFWPELFSPEYPPIVFRLVAPNVVVEKNKKRIHFASRTEYEEQKDKYPNWNVSYMKGLGSMEREDWEMILTNGDNFWGIVDDGKMKDTLELLFGPDSSGRKEWLTSDHQANHN